MRRAFLVVVSLVAYACGGSNSTDTFNAAGMSQANEPAINHAVPSTATGSAAVQIVGNAITYSLRATGLTGPATLAHIHLKPSDPATNGSVIVTFKTTAGTGTGTVTVDDTVPTAPQTQVPDATAKNLDGSAMTFQQLVDHIRNGDCYVNIHTAKNPAGEIRADLK
jgi:hypothetical protein